MLPIEEMSEWKQPTYPPAIELVRDIRVRTGPTFKKGEVLLLQPNGAQYARAGAMPGDHCLDAATSIGAEHDYWKRIDIHEEIQSVIDITGVDNG